MALHQHTIQTESGAKKKSKRVGRGNASGKGTYSSRGIKGQRSRSGGRGGLKLRGLKRTMLRLPKFKGQKPVSASAVVLSIADINKATTDSMVINKQVLVKAGLIGKNTKKVKVLGGGVFTKPVTLKGILVSEKVADALKNAGGAVADSSVDKKKQAAQEERVKEMK